MKSKGEDEGFCRSKPEISYIQVLVYLNSYACYQGTCLSITLHRRHTCQCQGSEASIFVLLATTLGGVNRWGFGKGKSPVSTTYSPRQTGKVLNKTPTCNMWNRVCVLISRRGISFIVLLYEHAAGPFLSFQRTPPTKLKCNMGEGLITDRSVESLDKGHFEALQN